MHHGDSQTPKRRPRAKTGTSFPNLLGKARRSEPSPATPSSPSSNDEPPSNMSLENLIEALTPPAVLSLAHARALVIVIQRETPPLRLLTPVLSRLCAPGVPSPFLATGMEIIAAYAGSQTEHFEEIERTTLFAILRSSDVDWTPDTWVIRLKCLSKLTTEGSNVAGSEFAFLEYIKACVSSAFEGLLSDDDSDRAPREKFLDSVSRLMRETLTKNASLYTEQDMNNVLVFFGGFLQKSLDSLLVTTAIPSSPDVPTGGITHRRNASSVSGPIFYPGSRPPPREPMSPLGRTIFPISLYIPLLEMYRSHMTPLQLPAVVSLLLRIVAVHIIPLPHLSVSSTPHHRPHPAQESALKQLFTLLSGPYVDTVARQIKRLMSSENLQESLGAVRTVRTVLRDSAESRMALVALRQPNNVVDEYAPSGQPVTSDAYASVLERAHRESLEVPSLTIDRLVSTMRKAVRSWLERSSEDSEKVLEEALGMVTDIMAEVCDRIEDNSTVEDRFGNNVKTEDYSAIHIDEGLFVGTILSEAVKYFQRMRSNIRNTYIPLLDKTPVLKQPFINLKDPKSSPTSLLLTLNSQLALPLSTPMTPSLPSILLSITTHLTDIQTSDIPRAMHSEGLLTPLCLAWLNNISDLFTELVSRERPITTREVFRVAETVYTDLVAVPAYRRKLGRRICELLEQVVLDEEANNEEFGMGGDESWVRLCTKEFVWRMQESAEREGDEPFTEEGEDIAKRIIAVFGRHVRSSCPCTTVNSDDPTTPPHLQDVTVPPTPGISVPSSNSSMVALSQERDVPPQQQSSNSVLPPLLSMLPNWSIARSREPEPPASPVTVQSEAEIPIRYNCRPVCAAIALVNAFQEISFAAAPQLKRSVDIFKILISILKESKCPKARLVVLQLLMRLRADRDHRLYILKELDKDIDSLAALVDRSRLTSRETLGDEGELHRARSTSRGLRRGRAKSSGPSRSRSRAVPLVYPTPPRGKPREPLWMVPEIPPFGIPVSEPCNDGVTTYEANAPIDEQWEEQKHWLLVSDYVLALEYILHFETDWEILSYVLCHLPVQLANKHFFCGPKTKSAIISLLITLCTTTFRGEFANAVAEQMPENLRLRDAQGLIFHTLVVLVSYRGTFNDRKYHDMLVESFLAGLNGQPSTVKVCLNALSICAYELPSSMTKNLSHIMEKLSRIMTNAEMAVHILDFVSIVGSLPLLYSNFREQEFKMVFAVAVTYIHYHNSPDTRGLSGRESFALSQHVLVVAYYIIYVWFLAVALPDRPNHVEFISRRLLLANEAKGAVDEPTEVCFDWLARYTYATADPRPANSLLGDIVMNPPRDENDELDNNTPESKVWLWGNSLVVISTLPKRGWIEVQSVRPSGVTKFLCKLENFPQVNPGDFDPDILSDPALMMLDRDPAQMKRDVPDPEVDQGRDATNEHAMKGVRDIFVPNVANQEHEVHRERPDPVTGYIWSKSAPSQRRKDVSIDPSFFALQLSQYPNLPKSHARSQRVPPSLNPERLLTTLKHTPVIDMHKIGILYVAPGQREEREILGNTHGSPAYTRFLEGIGRLIRVRDQRDVYAGGIVPETDGEYAYAWWDDIVQVVYHTATLMPNNIELDPYFISKKAHIGNDKVRIVWNDSGLPYEHNTILSAFNFVNIVIEPHSKGTIAAFSNSKHENEFFKVTMQRMAGMPAFGPIGDYKLVSADNLSPLLRQISLLADFFSEVYEATGKDTSMNEYITNWRRRLQYINNFRKVMKDKSPPVPPEDPQGSGGLDEERDFTRFF